MCEQLSVCVCVCRCESKGLKNTVNVHPASGIQPWEDTYTQMATAMGIDPEVRWEIVLTSHLPPVSQQTQKYVPFVPSYRKVSGEFVAMVPVIHSRVNSLWTTG